MIHVEVSATDMNMIIQCIHLDATVMVKDSFLEKDRMRAIQKLETLKSELEDVLKEWFDERGIYSKISLTDKQYYDKY